jgi:hypothetical protein
VSNKSDGNLGNILEYKLFVDFLNHIKANHPGVLKHGYKIGLRECYINAIYQAVLLLQEFGMALAYLKSPPLERVCNTR